MSPKTTNEKLAELSALVDWFEQGDVDLDEALKKFEEGSKLAGEIKKDLSEMENKIIVLKEKFEA